MIWRLIIGSACIIVMGTCVAILLALPPVSIFAMGAERWVYLTANAGIVVIASGAFFVLKSLFD